MKKEELDVIFDRMLSGYSSEIVHLANDMRNKIYEVLPQVTECIWERQKTIGYGTGPKKMSEHFCHISVYKNHINLGFNYGSELPDPENLLKGTGKLFRHIEIYTQDEIQNPALRSMLKFSTTHRVPPVK